MNLRSIGRSTLGVAVLVTALCALPGTAVAAPPAPPTPAPAPPAETAPRSRPGTAIPAPPPAPAPTEGRERPERPQVTVPQGAPETGGGTETGAGTDGLDAWPLALGAVGLAGAAGAAGVAVRRRHQDANRA